MLHRDLRKAQRAALAQELSAHQHDLSQLTEAAARLHSLRLDCSVRFIPMAERLVNRISAHPKHFDRVFADCALRSRAFDDIAKAFAHLHAQDTGPSNGTAMAAALATTLGAASATGLLGVLSAYAAAATSGWSVGTLAAAGVTLGGRAALGAVAPVAASGPLGWALGVGALAALAFTHAKDNREDAEKTAAWVERVAQERSQLQLVSCEIEQLRALTQTQLSGMAALVDSLEAAQLPAHYDDLTDAQLEQIGALVNHVQALSALMCRPVAAAQQQAAQDERPNWVFHGASEPVDTATALQALATPSWTSRLGSLFS